MKNLLIIGASGFGRDIYDMAKESIGYGTEFTIKGFLDLNLDALKEYSYYPQVISSEDDYEIGENDVFVCAIGDVKIKKKCTEKMLNRGAKFHTLIHKSALISSTSEIGEGCILASNVVVGSYAFIGNHCLLQSSAILGHDVKVGEYARIDCNVFFVGGVIVKDLVTIHTAAVINHDVILENNSNIGACSFVIKKVKEGTTVFGSPARVLKY